MNGQIRRPTLSALGIAVIVGGAGLVGPADAAHFGDWGNPQPLTGINDPVAADGCPIEAPDGASVFIASTRGGGTNHIWMAPLSADGQVSGAPEKLPAPVNSDAQEFCPTPLRGKALLFVSTRGGTDAYGNVACGAGDIYLTRRSPATGAWSEPRNLGCAPNGPNGPGTEYGPSLVETSAGVQLYFSTGGAMGSGTQDIKMSRRMADGSFGAPQPVAELNTGNDDAMPNVRKDGLEVVFTSSRPNGAGSFDIWTSTRASVSDPWSPPVNVLAVNSAGSETRPSLSWNAERLYLGRSGDIQVSHRQR